MGGHITITVSPLNRGIRAGAAVPPGRVFRSPIATVTLLDDLMANPAVVTAPFNTHERALRTLFNRFTNHWNHPLQIFYFFNAKSRGPNKPGCKINHKIYVLFFCLSTKFSIKFKSLSCFTCYDFAD
jgi:hypothetical protein